jgi:glyoxylase-like metal-dependent hydrolase (beta-lactamase superfamily II)
MIFVNNYKSNILLKSVVLMVSCVFFIDAAAYAAPTQFNATTLAAESRLKPFFQERGLEFMNRFAVHVAAARLRELNSTRGIRKSDVMNLNKGFVNDAVYIDPEIRTSRLKTTGRVYKYATFYFGQEKKPIEVRFIKDHKNLTNEELDELGLRTEENKVYFFSQGLPDLEGVWFVAANMRTDGSQGELPRSSETPISGTRKTGEILKPVISALKEKRSPAPDPLDYTWNVPSTSLETNVPDTVAPEGVSPKQPSKDKAQTDFAVDTITANMPVHAMAQIMEITKKFFRKKVENTKGDNFYVDVTKIPIAGTDTVLWVCQPPYGGNLILIEYGTQQRSYTLIDTGLGHYYHDTIAWFRDQGIDPGKIEKIVMLHSHPDHNGAVGYWQEDFPHIRIVAHPQWENIFDGNDPLRGTALKLLADVSGAKKPKQVFPFNPSALSGIQIGPKVFDVVGNIKAGALEFQVISFPAHTPDSVLLVEFSEKLIIAAEFLVDPQLIMNKERFEFIQDSVRLYWDYGVHHSGDMTFVKDNLRLRKHSTHRIEVSGHGSPQQRNEDDIFEPLPQFRVRKKGEFLKFRDTISISFEEKRMGSDPVKDVVSETERIHTENLKYTPTTPKKTILCHVITDSVLPAGQRNLLKSGLDQNMRGSEYREKIVALSVSETADTEEFMVELERVKARIRNEHKDYKVEFTVACPDRKGLVKKLQERGMKALSFSREGDGDIVQVEGILLALRALRAGKVDSLLHVYKFLTGREITEIPQDIEQLAKILVFIMPAKKADPNTEIYINGLIRKNILTAA